MLPLFTAFLFLPNLSRLYLCTLFTSVGDSCSSLGVPPQTDSLMNGRQTKRTRLFKPFSIRKTRMNLYGRNESARFPGTVRLVRDPPAAVGYITEPCQNRTLQKRMNYKIKCRKDKLIRCLSISMPFRLPQTTHSHIIGICKHFYAVQS